MTDERDPAEPTQESLSLSDDDDRAIENDRVEAGHDETDWSDMREDADDLGPDDYVRGTTTEYQGLAEEVQRASTEEWELQAVAATLPGVESGLVGFEDVSGTQSHSEESYELAEQAAASDLTMRVGSALVVFGLFLGSLVLGGWWFSAFVILVMVVALGELYATLRTRDFRPLALFGLLGVGLMGAGAHTNGPLAIAGWAVAAAAATILFFSLVSRREPLENAAVTVLGMTWVGMLSFAILIAAGPQPVALIMFIVLVVASNDVGAYFTGKGFGKTKLAPLVSPGKTVEGVAGGLVLAVLMAVVLAVFPPWEHIGIGQGIAIALLTSVVSPIGDLAESMVKRALGVKDMGSVLPGHGGMLDRIDGFLFTIPAIYVLLRGLGLL